LANGDELAVRACRFRVELRERAELVTGEQPAFKLRDQATIGDVTTIDPVLIVGSDPACDVVLYDDGVAPRHCLVIWTQEGPMLRSLHGGRGTTLNGAPIRVGRLVNGDRVGVGPYELAFEIEAGSAGLEETATVRPTAERRRPGPQGTPGGQVSVSRSAPVALVAGRIIPREVGNLTGLWPDWEPAAEPQLDRPKDEPVKSECPGFSNVSELSEGDKALLNREDGEGPTVKKMNTAEDGQVESVKTPPASSSTAAPMSSMDGGVGAESDRNLEERIAKVKARVAAAQEALDQRARKHWEKIEKERERLRAYHAELQEKATSLLNAARENRRLASEQRRTAGVGEAASPLPDADLLAELSDEPGLRPATNRATVFTASVEDNEMMGAILRGEGGGAWQDRTTELEELVRGEQDEIAKAQSHFAALRLSISRLRDFVQRTGQHQRVFETELDSRLETWLQGEASLQRERALLMARIKEIDSKAVQYREKIEETRRCREDLEREKEQLTRVQIKIVEKEEALRTDLEMERRRIHVRQTELQRKAAELARADLGKEYEAGNTQVGTMQSRLRGVRGQNRWSGGKLRGQFEEKGATLRAGEAESQAEDRACSPQTTAISSTEQVSGGAGRREDSQ
jgi:pSer/pThr/pTyr-binding forkhead associated (FHA) protein